MTDGYTIKDVTEDLKYLVSLTNVFEVDNEGYLTVANTSERAKPKLDGADSGSEIVLVQGTMPKGEYLTFNPFSEGLGRVGNPANNYYYQAIRVATNATMMVIFFHVARTILTAKKAAAAGEEFTISPAVVKMAGVQMAKRQTLYDVIDDEMIKEFKTLCDRIDDTFFFVPYDTRDMTARVTCSVLTDAEWDAKYAGKDVRKRSVAAFKALIMGVFGITAPDQLSKFSVKYSELNVRSAPRFHTTMSVYLKLYEVFNEVAVDAYTTDGTPPDTFVVDLGALNDVIERFPAAYNIAKHMMQTNTAPSVKAADTASSDTRGMRFQPHGTGTMTPDGKPSRFKGPPVVGGFGVQPQPGFMMGQPQPQQNGRFRPHIVDNTPADPFSPSGTPGIGHNSAPSMSGNAFGVAPTMMAPMMGPGMGGGMGGGMGMMSPMMGNPASPAGAAFGAPVQAQQNMFGSPSMGFNMSAPSNFGEPGTRRFFPS
jgi:hypothetical protein